MTDDAANAASAEEGGTVRGAGDATELKRVKSLHSKIFYSVRRSRYVIFGQGTSIQSQRLVMNLPLFGAASNICVKPCPCVKPQHDMFYQEDQVCQIVLKIVQ